MYIPLPLGTTATEAASRVRGWIETILDYAKTRACRGGDRRGHLDKMPPKKAKVAPVVHHAAMPYSQIAMFMSKLGEQDEDQGMLALELPIVTASRSVEGLKSRQRGPSSISTIGCGRCPTST